MRIKHRPRHDRIFLKAISILLVIMQIAKTCLACGSYQKVGKDATLFIGTETSYGPYLNCIWWLETEVGYQLSINVTWVGDENYGRCGDFIIIHDDTSDGATALLDRSNNCTSLTGHVVTARASWLRVQFKSDGLTATAGFQGFVQSTYVGDSLSSYSTPIKACRSYEWTCSNKECQTVSYRCDGFNDCGCDHDCDEQGCEGLTITKMVQMIIGAVVGVSIFLVFFFFSLAYESHLKRRTLMADPEAVAEMQRKKAEKKRREAYQKAAKEKKEFGDIDENAITND